MRLGFLLLAGSKFGGMERRYVRICQALGERGYDVRLYCTEDARNTIERLGVNVSSVKITLLDRASKYGGLVKKLARALALFRLCGLVRSNKVEHLHVIGNPGWVAYYCVTFLPSMRVSLSAVDSLCDFNDFLLRKLCDKAVAIDCLSGPIATYICSKSTDSAEIREKIKVAPCSFTDLSKVKTADVRDIDVLMLARFTSGKGYELLERAYEQIKHLQIHLCGFGIDRPAIEGASIYETKDSFSVLSRTKIFLSIQKEENYPSQSLLEAMASGCAIIATDVGVTRQILDEESAILIPYDHQALAEAILRLAADESARVSYGKRAKGALLRNHTVERYIEYFEKEILFAGHVTPKI